MAMKLVKYNCGCIGFYPPLESGKSIIIDYCATDQCDIGSLGVSLVEIKSPHIHDDLHEEKVMSLFNDIGKLIGEGYRFRQIKQLLS